MSKRILLVEDEPNIVISLSFLLERAGFDVATETNGQTALDKILTNPPDALVLDVMLPGLDGFEILRRIRADTQVGSLPILMLTAKGQREDRKNALEFGADIFISKPFSNAEVIAAVKKLTSSEQQ